MSHFELRDAMATSGSGTSREFSGRVADVFSKLGSGLVKTDQESVEEVRNIKEEDFEAKLNIIDATILVKKDLKLD